MSRPLTRTERAVLYVALPTATSLTLVAMYFSGSPGLKALVAPGFNREFGILENLQLACLATFAVLVAQALRRASTAPARVLLGVALLGSVFVLLEEMDYGLHFVEFVRGTGWQEGVRNLHNLGNTNSRLKSAGDLVMTVLFGLAPFWFPRSRHALLREHAPPKAAVLGALASLGVSFLAHRLQHATGQHGPIHSNISEFRELWIYCLMTTYAYDLTHRAPGEQRAAEECAHPAEAAPR